MMSLNLLGVKGSALLLRLLQIQNMHAPAAPWNSTHVLNPYNLFLDYEEKVQLKCTSF